MGGLIGAGLGLLIGDVLWGYYFAKEDTGKQDKILTPGDIKELKDRFIDPEDLKGGRKTGELDLYKKPNGDIVVKPKGGRGEGEPTGYNIKDICKR